MVEINSMPTLARLFDDSNSFLNSNKKVIDTQAIETAQYTIKAKFTVEG